MPSKLFKTHKTVVLQKLPSGSCNGIGLSLLYLSAGIITSSKTNLSFFTYTHTGWFGLPGCSEKVHANMKRRNEEYKLPFWSG